MSLPVHRASSAFARAFGFAWVLAVALAALAQALVLPAAAFAAEGPVVRVLLERGLESLSVAPRGRTALRIVARGSSIRVDGRPLGSRWESTGQGTHIVTSGGGRARWVIPGRIRVHNVGSELLVVGLVPLEAYVEGTVAREMPTSWEAAALRAQAVVSRTYGLRAIAEPKDPLYDVAATTESQVFGAGGSVAASVRKAVRATRGQVLTYRGEPILAAFHSASGGVTAGAEEVWGRQLPYLRSREVGGEEEAPSTYWRAAVSRTTLRLALSELGLDVGPLERVEVVQRWPSGRVKRIAIAGPNGEQGFSGRLLREALGQSVVKSTLFELRERGDDIVLVGSGHGHGVGMSQWGAKSMASRGASHREILAVFYPGTKLQNGTKIQAGATWPGDAIAEIGATPAVASGREN